MALRAAAPSGYIVKTDKYWYATIKGAGHEAPEYQPWSSFHLFQRYLSEEGP